MKQHVSTRRKKPLSYAILSVIIGPFGVMALDFWKGMFMLCVPFLFVVIIDYLMLGGNLAKLSHYGKELSIWGVAYWILCICISFTSARAYNAAAKEARLNIK